MVKVIAAAEKKRIENDLREHNDSALVYTAKSEKKE
jgi:hypothetical protein